MSVFSVCANCTLIFGMISIFCLVTLHVVNKEFHPSFRMISEYALGKHTWLLTLFFFSWGFSTIASGFMLWDIVTSNWAKLGIIFLFMTGFGAIMGGLFDVQHKLHGLSAAIGIPFMPVGALLISYHLLKKDEWQHCQEIILYSSHATWVSLAFMFIAMFLLFSSLKSAGIEFGPNSQPFEKLPKDVIGINGWANRLLVLCYLLYPMLVARMVLLIY